MVTIFVILSYLFVANSLFQLLKESHNRIGGKLKKTLAKLVLDLRRENGRNGDNKQLCRAAWSISISLV